MSVENTLPLHPGKSMSVENTLPLHPGKKYRIYGKV